MSVSQTTVARVTAGLKCAPDTQPNMVMIAMTTRPKESAPCNPLGGPSHGMQLMQPRNISSAVPISSPRNAAIVSTVLVLILFCNKIVSRKWIIDWFLCKRYLRLRFLSRADWRRRRSEREGDVVQSTARFLYYSLIDELLMIKAINTGARENQAAAGYSWPKTGYRPTAVT